MKVQYKVSYEGRLHFPQLRRGKVFTFANFLKRPFYAFFSRQPFKDQNIPFHIFILYSSKFLIVCSQLLKILILTTDSGNVYIWCRRVLDCYIFLVSSLWIVLGYFFCSSRTFRIQIPVLLGEQPLVSCIELILQIRKLKPFNLNIANLKQKF